MKCRICGLATPNLRDHDSREGYIAVTLEFGPNILNGKVNESGIAGYRVYMVGPCLDKIGQSLVYVNKTEHGHQGEEVSDICGCPTWVYTAQVTGKLPDKSTAARLMITPVTTDGYELPMGMTSATLEDYYTTNSTTSSTTTSTRTTTTTTVATNYTNDTVTIVKGSMGLIVECATAPAYARDPKVNQGWVETFAKYTGVPPSLVAVAMEPQPCSRRLGENGPGRRRLQGETVKLNYAISLPNSPQSPSSPQSPISPQSVLAKLSQGSVANDLSKLATEIVNEKVGAGVYTMSVGSVQALLMQAWAPCLPSSWCPWPVASLASA